MVRQEIHNQVRIGEFREFYKLFQQLNEAVRNKKLTPSQLWTSYTGTVNRAVIVTDYETIEALDREGTQFQTDPDCMTLWRDMGKHLAEIPSSEIWESAYEIA